MMEGHELEAVGSQDMMPVCIQTAAFCLTIGTDRWTKTETNVEDQVHGA